MTDQVGDMLTRIRNAVMRFYPSVDIPHSKFKQGIARVLRTEGYISDYDVIPGLKPGEKKRVLRIYLKYSKDRQPCIQHIGRVSKPGRRIFCKVNKIPKVLDGFGICILSTNKGILSSREAKRLKVGGELICKVW
jgi:small subunit ribosomal protein S8